MFYFIFFIATSSELVGFYQFRFRH